MPILGGTWILFNEFKRQMGLKTIDLVNDVFKVALMSSDLVPNIDAHSEWPDISMHEIAGNGYTVQNLSEKTWVRNDEVDAVIWGAATVSFGPAVDGPIAARRAVIYDDTTVPKYLVAHCLLDGTDVDLTAPEGVSLGVALPSGIVGLV